MQYSMYVGRVGALALALGIGAAVATNPGVAWAQDAEHGSTVGADAGNQPAPEPGTQVPQDGGASEGGGNDPGADTRPPDMNVGGTTIDTSTHDDNAGGGVDDGEEFESDLGEDEEQEGDAGGLDDEAPVNNPGPEAGENQPRQLLTGDSRVTEYRHDVPSAQRQEFSSNTADTDSELGAGLRPAGETADEVTTTQSFKTTSLDHPPSETETLSGPLVQETAEVRGNPVAGLITLPLRIVSDVLNTVVGGPNTPPGENPFFLGVLAWVRRQFENSFARTFVNQAPDITAYSLVENADGSFTVTVDTDGEDAQATDPDGDPLSFSATDGEDGTVVQTAPNTFVYTPPATDWDGTDTFTLSVSDPGGFFGFNRRTDSIEVMVEAGDQDPTQPEVVQPPTQQQDGSVEAKLEFDPAEVTSVTVAPGFEPKYWTYEEVYNQQTGEYDVKLTPTQAGMLRAALGLDTTDTLGLEVTTTEQQTIQTFALRSVSFAALEEEPDYTVNLPDVPSGRFVLKDPIVTSPGASDPESTYPAGVVVTERYAYVVNSNVVGGGAATLTVIGADADKSDYLQVVDEIAIGGSALLVGLAGDRLYIATSGGTLAVVDTDGNDPLVETDDNTVLDPVDVGDPNGVVPIISPDEKTIYLVNQQFGRVDVIDIDPANTSTYHTVVDSIDVAEDPVVVDNGDGTFSGTAQFPLSGAFNADGTRLYLVRDTQSYTQNPMTGAISDYTFTGEILTIDTATNEVIGTPLSLGDRYGYFTSSDGEFLYVPTLDMNGFVPAPGADPAPIIGSVTVIDVRDRDNPAVVAELPSGNLPVNVAFSPDKSLAYVVDAGEGTVWLIDTVNQEVLDLDPGAPGVQGLVFDDDPTAELGRVFNVIAASPDGTRLFVTNFGKGTLVPLEFVRDDVVV